MNLNTIITSIAIASPCVAAVSQNTSTAQAVHSSRVVGQKNSLRISGYIQTQAQWGDSLASLNVGTPNIADASFSRIGIRRGHVKLTFEQGGAKAVVQIDATERKLSLKDAYLQLTKRWLMLESSSITMGLFNRPFGYEVGYSSAKRESPERARIYPILLPNERDLGAMITLQSKPYGSLHKLKLEVGLFAGNGINPEMDNRLDFIGRLSASNSPKARIRWGAGFSYYRGALLQPTPYAYSIQQSAFERIPPSKTGGYALREYLGIDAQCVLRSPLGITHVRGEFLMGQQPGEQANHKSPTTRSNTGDTYLRHFSGGYAMLVHYLPKLPVGLVMKYDWFDPNVDIATDKIGLYGTTAADIAYQGIGLGVLYDVNLAARLHLYYDRNINETSPYLKGYEYDRADDVLTLRLQYSF